MSFKLNLTGPSVNVQSACSTSLLAVHLACRGLLDGEADMALAGASVVRIPHLRGYLAEPGGIYSGDGHTRAFDAKASGTLFGSGVAAVLLKPLAAALADGDQVYAIIKGTAINNDGGRKMSYTASAAFGQTRAVTDALRIANVDPSSLGYVECHGTGTALGDPVEIQALSRAFIAAGASRANSCAIGSVKSNFGHLEQCAGMAGLIKSALALKHGVIPPSLHYETLNPRIPLDRSPFFVNAAPQPFQHPPGPRRAGVNSVGMGGTNGFAVLEEAPPPSPRLSPSRPILALALSASTPEALIDRATGIRAALASAGASELPDMCTTANRGRHHFGHRFLAVGSDRNEMIAELDRYLRGEGAPLETRGSRHPAPIVFLYSGQGAQYAHMGEAVYRGDPTFRAALDRCFSLFAEHGIPIADVFFRGEEHQLKQTLFAQPALFSLQVALTELWSRWGIVPACVIGHSIGEFAAAVAAGVSSLEDAVTLVAARARLMEDLPDRGAMVAVATDPDTIRRVWPEGRDDVAVAAVNAPNRIVVAGSTAALASLLPSLQELGVPFTALNASHAFHSPLMDPVLDSFSAIAKSVSFEAPRVRWISTLTGTDMAGAPDARYWSDQIRCAVRFHDAIDTVAQSSMLFLEIGPDSTLVSLARQCVTRGKAARLGIDWVCSLARDTGDWKSLLKAVGHLYLKGYAIRWDVLEPADGRRVSLPTYPFQHKRWWLEPRVAERQTMPVGESIRHEGIHPFLGARLGGEDDRFESLLDLGRLSFLSDHRVFQRVVLPTTAVLETVTLAARQFLGFSRPVITDFLYELRAIDSR